MEGMSEEDMGGMSMATSPLLGGDAGDAVYPHHLINGHSLSPFLTLDPLPRSGDRVRLRFINAASDTAYRVAIGGHRMTVTHADGLPVVPVQVDAFLIGMGERYDVTIDVHSGAWPIIALAEGKDSRGGAVLRTRDSGATPSPDLLATPSELEGEWLRYSSLRAAESVALTLPRDIRSIPINLTGEGEWVTLDITNTTSMWHPVHLHGHTPQLTDMPGGVRKDTVNVLPGDTVQLAFQSNNPGDWMLHCHNAYHLEAGMATLLRYRNGE
jgi:FtsP/CotA-like multicopper oxidase with cupredoxin domain